MAVSRKSIVVQDNMFTEDAQDVCSSDDEHKHDNGSHRHNEMKDWRADGINVCTAYFTKRLRRADYNVINNYFWAHFFVAVLTVCVSVAGSGSIGLPVGAAILHFMWLTMSLSGNL